MDAVQTCSNSLSGIQTPQPLKRRGFKHMRGIRQTPSMTTLHGKASESMPQCLHKYEMKPATSNEEVVCKPAHHPTYSGNRRLLDK